MKTVLKWLVILVVVVGACLVEHYFLSQTYTSGYVAGTINLALIEILRYVMKV